MTNRALYLFVADLVRRHGADGLSLEVYLARLGQRAQPWRDREAVPVAAFARLITDAFTEPAPPSSAPAQASAAFLGWEELLTGQRRDLAEMAAAGILAQEERYFGVDAPSGARWYNFDPGTYLECAATGTFGGWEESDDTGRAYVPGNVVVLDPTGQLTSVDPRELEDPIIELDEISWAAFSDFLECGRCYE